jgi:hypothetical protein
LEKELEGGELQLQNDEEIVRRIVCRGEWRERRKVFEFCIFGVERQTML